MPSPFPVLPPTYYRDHFMEMADFVADLYHAHLDGAERDFLFLFRGMSQDAQCLFIRMANRKAEIFARADLEYAEIADRDTAIAELVSLGLVRRADAGDYASLLSRMNKDELKEIALRHGLENFRQTWPKAKAVEFIVDNISYAVFAEHFDCDDHLVPLCRDNLHFLLYLYFGRLQTNLTSFALRDMGIVSVKAREKYQARFRDMDEARSGFFYTKLIRDIKKAGQSALHGIAAMAENFPPAVTDMVKELRSDAIFRLGQFFERRKYSEQALDLYSLSDCFACRERKLRLLYAQGNIDEVKTYLETMIENPNGEEEYIFAKDFYERKFGTARRGIFTELLNGAQEITVDDAYRGYPEYAAIRHYEVLGYKSFHVENGLWPTLFALIFWEEIFESVDSFSSAFDAIPQSLKDKSFYSRHMAAIKAKLNGDMASIVAETIRYHEGEENGLFYWVDDLGAMIEAFLKAAPPVAVAQILEKMAQDFYAYRDGFPDLLLMRADEIRFVEIKGEGDQLRRNQLARLNLLKSAGFAAEIVRVKFRVDPEQIYVVIDVETTGGRPPFDRVTEIGAVKVKDGTVIDSWQSLINPERLIPAGITQLTGITNAMVRNAPKFAEIAEELEGFLEGAVFVAHNVNFDHGFIASEFRRLEKPFRYPKMCTVSMMRKHYPGNDSYSLANLCHVFDIELENHHRALADAQAAAELLLLVNRKRLAA